MSFDKDNTPFSIVVTSPEDGKRPIITFFDKAPVPRFSQRGVNGDPRRRYVDIGREHLKLITDEFSKLKSMPGFVVSDPLRKNEDPDLVQYVRFGSARKTAGQQHNSQAFRGYLLIPPESAFPAIQRLDYLSINKLVTHLEYKFRYPQVVNGKWPRYTEISLRESDEALYIDDPMGAIITLYADTQEELTQIFELLVVRCGWNDLENQKKGTTVGINISKPQKASLRFFQGMKEFTTLEYNSKPGFSEN